MILKTLLGIGIATVVIRIMAKVFATYELEFVGEKKSERKHTHYIRYSGWNEEQNRSFLYHGEEVAEDGKPSYIYRRYIKTPKNIFSKLDVWFSGLFTDTGTISTWIGSIYIAVLVVVLFVSFCGNYVHNKNVLSLDHQRQYVEKLNDDIETIVNTYMEHEKITFKKDVSLEALIITYPELRSVELVTSQIETLKEEQEKLNNIEVRILEFENFEKWFGW